MNAPRSGINCEECDVLLPGFLDGELDASPRAVFDAHVAGCARCRGLIADLTELREDAARLPVLKPSRDLWDGISARIETPAIALHDGARRSPRSGLRIAAAAALLVATTATATWTIARRSLAVPEAGTNAVAAGQGDASASSFRVAAAYDGEIAEMRRLVENRPQALDSATARVLAINLRVIDDAIARVREALDRAPSNALLAQQLARAYDMKLNTLRQFAEMGSE
jgi:hypothetical protein